MMPRCLANGCRNGCETPEPSISFHAFPEGVEAARRWAGLCGLPEEDLARLTQDTTRGDSAKYHLCSLHFVESDFETHPSPSNGNETPRGEERKLRHGTEPSLLLATPSEPSEDRVEHHDPSVDPESRAESPETEARARSSDVTTCPEVSSPDLEKFPPSESLLGRSCACTSHYVTQTVVRSAHQNVNQVILDFLEKNEKLPRDNVSVQSAAQSLGSCHSTQHTARQIVLIFMESPNTSSKQTPASASQESPLSTTVSTQTEITGWPGDPPHYAKHTPTPVCQEPPRTVNCSTQTELRNENLQTHLRNTNEEAQSPSSLPQRPPAPQSLPHCGSCVLTPSLNQYVDHLLSQGRIPSSESELSSCASSFTSSCSCRQSQPVVKQIILNFLESENNPVKQDTPCPRVPRDQSPPAGPSHQHVDTQTDDEYSQKENLREPTDKPQIPPESRHPPASPCTPPPSLNQDDDGRTGRQRLKSSERRSVRQPQSREFQKDPVSFDEVAVYFSEDEWRLLEVKEKALYKEVMMENYQAVCSLGYSQGKPGLILRIEQDQYDLWEESDGYRRSSFTYHEEGHWCLLDVNVEGIHFRDEQDTQKPLDAADRGALRGSSHLGALMRLVNEIPGFLLGSAVTDGSVSPAWSSEDHENLGSVSEIKTEDNSPACTPITVCVQHTRGTPDTGTINPRMEANPEPAQIKPVIKTEESKAEVAVDVVSRLGSPFCSPPGLSFSKMMRPPCEPPAKRECRGAERSIKQEGSPPLSPVHGHPGHRDIPGLPSFAPCAPRAPPSYSPSSQGERMVGSMNRRNFCKGRTSPWLPAAAKPGHVGGLCGTKSAGLDVRIKQEDCEGEDPAAGRPAGVTVLCERPTDLPQQDKDRRRSAGSPGRSPVDNFASGLSHLRGLVNCLKEISTYRPRPPFTLPRWGSELSKMYSEAAVRSAGFMAGRASDIRLTPPNPFTVAVTNGVSRVNYTERRTPETSSPHSTRDGRCLEKVAVGASGSHSSGRSRPQRSEEMLRPNLGIKRAHSEDLPLAPGTIHGTKRPSLEASSPSHPVSSISPGRRDVRQHTEELQSGPSDGSSAGRSHLVSVVDCVKKIMPCRPSPPAAHHYSSAKASVPARGPGTRESDASQSCAQSINVEGKIRDPRLQVKEEKSPSPSMLMPSSPRETEGQGSSSRNIHLNSLMKLMEELPRSDAGSLSRAMYSIAVGRSEIRRTERTTHLPYPNDDGIFQPESNDTVASVDSVFSDDTSLSSENVDPSYSAIGGLQKVVSEFAELGSVSPLVAVAVPPVTGSVHEESGHRRGRDRLADSARIQEKGRGPVRDVLLNDGSLCSAEDGKASYAALCGLEKVVHGFSEQNCVSPFSAVRIPSASNLSEITTSKHPDPDDTDSSYSALCGLQKVVNGFSEMGCVSPFSAISTTASDGAAEAGARRRGEQPTLDTSCGHNTAEHFPKSSLSFLTDEDWPVGRDDSSYSALTGLQKVVNGVPDMGCLSPLTVVSIPSSDGDQEPGLRRRCEEVCRMSPRPVMERPGQPGHTAPARPDTGPTYLSNSPWKTPAPYNQCIDLTEDEEEINSTQSCAERPHKLPPRGTNTTLSTPDKQQKHVLSLRSTNTTSPFTSDNQQKHFLSLRSTNTTSPSTPDKQQTHILNPRSTNTTSPSTPDKQQTHMLSLRNMNTTSPSTPDKQQTQILNPRSTNTTSPSIPDKHQTHVLNLRGSNIALSTLDNQQGPSSSRGTTPSTPDREQNLISKGSNSTCSTPDGHQKLVSREASRPQMISASCSQMLLSSHLPVSQALSTQCIDLTMEEPPPKPKDLSFEPRGGTVSHCVSTRKPHRADKRHRPYIDLTRDTRRNVDKPLDPGPSVQERTPSGEGVPVLNEHLSGLEKLLKDMPSFQTAKNTGGYGRNATWWFKSTSPHET